MHGPSGSLEGRKSRTISSTALMDRLQTIDQAADEIAPGDSENRVVSIMVTICS
jgi:hypothetical protein